MKTQTLGFTTHISKPLTNQPKKMKTTTTTAARVKYLRDLNLDDTITWSVTGPRGGKSSNSRGTPSAGWTRAAHLAGYKSEPYWSGSNPTPVRHFGPAIIAAIRDAPADLQYH